MIKNTEMQIEKFERYFTDDGWYLVKSYFSKLRTKMEDLDVPKDKQNSTFRGLNEYLEEFIEDKKERGRINFDLALKLVQEIGSPTEIFIMIDYPNKNLIDESKISYGKGDKGALECKNCFFKNVETAKYCENCGQELLEKLLKTKIKQGIIDHPYLFSFAFMYLTLIFLAQIIIIIWKGLQNYSDPVFTILTSILYTFVPVLMIALISGWILDKFFGDQKSFKIKYTKLLNDFENNFAAGSILTFISGSIIFSLGVLLQWIIFVLTAIFIIIGIFISLAIEALNRPSDIPYLQLLMTKKKFEIFVQKKVQKSNIFVGIVIIIVTISYILALITFFPDSDFYGVIITASLLAFALLSGFNGFSFMYFYSWPFIKKQIKSNLELL